MDAFWFVLAPTWALFIVAPLIIWYLATPRGWRL
jgi:hypothetical protein